MYNASELFAADDSITSRGYTGHEMLDEVGLIHMNGRIYDARLARFMQADPFVQAATDVQMYNRYSYLRNNPLNATDPSGYFLKRMAKRVLGSIAGNSLISGLINVGLNLIPGCAVWCSAVFTSLTTYAVTGSLSQSLRAGAISGASAYAFSRIGDKFKGFSDANVEKIFKGDEGIYTSFGTNTLTHTQVRQQILAHAITGGVTASLQGGKFGHGFISAGVTKGVMGSLSYGSVKPGAVLGRTSLAAVVGGTTSAISGGKFANGAVTGAIGHLLNGEKTAKANAQKARLERIRKFREETRGSLNPFEIIAKEFPKWWSSSETEDLRTGLDLTVDAATVPYKVLRLPVDIKDYAVAAGHALDGEYAEAGIKLGEVLIGKGTVKQLETFNIKNDMFVNGAGVVTSNVGEEMLNQDCYVCK